MTISLALGMTGSVTSGMKLDAVAGFINKTAVWLLSISSTLFVGLLSLQSLVGAAADTLGGRPLSFPCPASSRWWEAPSAKPLTR